MIEISSIEHLQKILQSDGRILILDFMQIGVDLVKC